MEEATEEALREALHGYKKGTIDGDELAHELACVLSTDDARVVRIMDEVFPEFRELAPESSRATLRSHMTSGWFQTLGAIWDRAPLPLRLFSVDRCFRREQEEGPTRLMTYHSASCVVAGEDVTNEAGKAVAAALLSAFGFDGLPVPARREAVQVLHARLADRGLRPPPGDRLGRGRDLRALLALGPRRVRGRRAGHEPRASAWSGSRWS